MNDESDADDLREEYEFTPDQLRHGVRGKYVERYAEGTNLIPLNPNVAEIFPDAAAVNQVFRALDGIARA